MTDMSSAIRTTLNPKMDPKRSIFGVLNLLFTCGVVERIGNMSSSLALEEFKGMERILSDLRFAYPIIRAALISEEEEIQKSETVYYLKVLKRIAYEIEHLLDEYNYLLQSEEEEIQKSETVSYLKDKHGTEEVLKITRLSKILSKLLQLYDIVEDGAGHKSTFVPASVTGETDTSSRYCSGVWSLPEDTIVGREEEKKEIIDMIFKNHQQHPNVIEICGEAGIGKTTLAKMIYNDHVRVSSRFDLLSWACIPKTKDIEDTLVQIIQSFRNKTPLYLERLDLETLERTLRDILTDTKFLLILDYKISDYTYISWWWELEKIFKVGLPGSTVIFTGISYRGISWQRGSTAKIFNLRGLTEDQSWSLFALCAGFDEDAEKDQLSFLTSIGTSLVDKCLGCPLAIKTLGSMLRTNRDEHSWRQIQQSKIWNEPIELEHRAFAISLEHMSPALLQCLCDSSILSRYGVKSKDQLMCSWMALGLLYSRDGNEDPVDIGSRYFDELVSRCFFQLYRNHGHDMVVVYDQVLLRDIMSNEIVVLPQHESYLTRDYRYAIRRSEWCDPSYTLPTVRTSLPERFFGRVSRAYPREIFCQLINAHVVLLDGSEFEELPENIGDLKLLRYLSLAGNHLLKELPESLCNLLNLQTLDLSGCEQLQTLPQNMHKLLNLRHLFLSLNLTNVPETSIQSLTSLRHLKICDSPNLNSLPEGIAYLNALKVLQIHDCPSIASLPNNINCLTSLTEISIINCAMLDLTNWDGLEGLNGLEFLQIQGLPKLNKFPEGLTDSLRHLVVSNCQGLIELPESLQKCTNLTVMDIEHCPSIRMLPEGIQEIKTLQLLKIVNCPELIARCQREVGRDWHLISHIPRVQLHPEYQKRATISALDIFVGDKRSAAVKMNVRMRRIESLLMNTWFRRLSFKLFDRRKAPKPKIFLPPFSEHRATDEEKDTMHPDSEIQVQKPVSQTKATTNLSLVSTSTVDEHPESSEIQEKAWERQKLIHDILRMDEEVFIRASVMTEETKDPYSILFLLPEDYEIEKDTLIQLWMAAELIKDELNGDKYFTVVLDNEYLLHCGTNFMTGKDKYQINTEKINELLDTQKDNAKFYLKWKKEYQDNSMPAELIQHVSLGCSTEIDATTFQTLEKFKQLRTLLFLGNHGHKAIQMPSHLFSSFIKLRALDLSRTHLQQLSTSISHMIHLRYLDVSWTLIKRLPDIICSLAELQTLKLRGCTNLSVLPQQFNRLTKLRHLDIDVLRQLDIMPKGIGALVHLRTLSAFLVGTEDGYKLQELKQLNNISGNLCIAKLENVEDAEEASEVALHMKKQLKKLELRWTPSGICGTHRNSYAVIDNLEPYQELEELQILCYEGTILPLWIGDPKYNKLNRIVFYRCENLLEFPEIEELPHLKHLELVKMNSVKRIQPRELLKKSVAFPKLAKLEINNMQSLEVWDWKKRNKRDFMSLTHLIIEKCPELQEFDVLPHLSAIEYFEIRECPKLQSLSDMKLPDSVQELVVEDCPQIQKKCSEDEGEDWHKIEHVPNKSIQEVNVSDQDHS